MNGNNGITELRNHGKMEGRISPFRHSVTPSFRNSRSGAVMMEYVIVVVVMAIAMVFAATWLTGWDGGDTQNDGAGATFNYGGQLKKDQGIGPELKGMYQRVQAGIALPIP